jgi:hypothetical protein
MYKINSEIKLLNSSELSKLSYESDILLSAIKDLILKDEQILKDTTINLKEKIKNDQNIKDLNDESSLKSSYFNAMYDDEIQLVKEINRLQRYSKLLILFVFYEDMLRKLAEFKGINGKKKNDNISDLEFFRNKILEQCIIDNNSEVISFNYINSQKFVRNKIAHSNGVFSQNEKHKFYKQPGLEEIESGEEFIIRIVSPNYLLNLLEQIDTNLKSLLSLVDNNSSI